ncbi:ornithine decarboxylase 2-like isoform X1 [Colletes gigas]|uniref:ornithine decarboxylase 2-like isoform X1 n=1 Tax=Colletes gigas TaxID=935657 RepID=UPI001C9B97C7|nr:ornithine decarboxylase 2-like isoform X1 [Colletes gigas]XP_043260343.1 ornithine decarboxylase 2-like isoform X1 [Colletes gigas]
MSGLNSIDVKLFEDTANDIDIIKTIIDTDNNEEPFYILDVADIVQKHQNWIAKMPRVSPHYAVKCNSDPTVIKILAALNANFDCASEQEIRLVMKHGVSAERIIFANPTKLPSHIRFAKMANVFRTTVDSESEILKMKDLFPEAKIVIRIRCDAKVTQVCFGTKFGCDPNEEAVRLIRLTRSLGLTLHGFSFHVGSPCGEMDAYNRGITMCKRLVAIAKTIGCNDVQMIDIGGGFPGETDARIDEFATVINDAIEDIDPSIKIISEPGQYYVSSAFTLASCVHTKRTVNKEKNTVRMYYVYCGVYTSFIDELLNLKARIPITLDTPAEDRKFNSSVFGPTCDSLDCILKNVWLPELEIGDWLIWRDMGAYSIAASCSFNGFLPPVVYPFARKSKWAAINAIRSLHELKESVE